MNLQKNDELRLTINENGEEIERTAKPRQAA
jgi:hypothetical protein